ncbi:MAG TPA: hypothetical protein VNT03_11545 [Baekduia sp.]|nr:hypothetical protein [Baekduia sp.]
MLPCFSRAAAAGAAVAALAAIAAAPAAQADSIAYIKDGDVHLTTPDGNTDHQVTTAGGYSTASQADDGRILALHGKRFHLLDQWGRVQADFSPIADGTAGTVTVNGPFDPVISPDGTKVAYGMYVQYTHGNPICGLPGGCWEGHLYAATGYSPSTGPGDWSNASFVPNFGWTDPSWIDNSRTLLSGPASAYLSDTGVDTLGDDKHEAAEWFSDHENNASNLFDGAMNRQGTGAAYVVNTTGDELRIYHANGAPIKDNPPTRCLSAPKRSGAWESPSWSPDGNRMAASDASGLYVVDFPGIQSGCPDAKDVKVIAIAPGGKRPSWGPANLPDPSTRPADAAGGSGAKPAVTTATPAPGAVTTPAPARAKAALSGTILKATKTTITVKVTTPAAGRLAATALLGKKAVASAAGRKVKAGAITLTLKTTKNGRRALKKAGAKKVVVRATFTPAAGGKPQQLTITRG